MQTFQFLMKIMAAPLIISLSLWLFLENRQLLTISETVNKKRLTERKKFMLWGILIITSSIIIEWAGVKSGVIFGDYSYGSTLPPYIEGVPLAIGFAWLGMLLASITLGQRVFPHFYQGNALRGSFLAGIIMTLFDAFMEPAAIRLGYWNWHSGIVPLQNYMAWFLISFILAYAGFRMGLFTRKLSIIGIHAYVTQLIYFILVYFS